MNNHWTDNPAFPVADWQAEVANGDTRLGYAEWVREQGAQPAPDVIIDLDGGLVRDVRFSTYQAFPYAVEIHDYDVEGVDDADVETDAYGREYLVWGL